MAEARVVRPKGITKADWDEFINRLDDYRGLNPTDPDYDAHRAAQGEDIADQAVAMFLYPLTP